MLYQYGGRPQQISHLTTDSNGNHPASRGLSQWQRYRVGGSLCLFDWADKVDSWCVERSSELLDTPLK
jgi:hypothetical protein